VKHPVCKDGVLAVTAGLLLYAVAAGLETVLRTGLWSSTLLEELGKAVVLLVFGGTWRNTARAGRTVRQARSRALGLARGLSLGLVAIAVFAGAENMAYFLAFREAGVLARLFWSLPVHLVAGLVEALGTVLLFRCLERKPGFRARLGGMSLWFSSLCLACAWHGGANGLVSGHLASSTFLGGIVIANLLFLVLLSQFLKQAYLGGFLHGAD
jgi:hypothetical protein